MTDFTLINEVTKIVATSIGIIAVLGGFIFWIIKLSFKRGELYQLFKTLVEEVSSIKKTIDAKFIDNDAKHTEHKNQFRKHDKRITTLEVKSDAKKDS